MRVEMRVHKRTYSLREPFIISGHEFLETEVIIVSLSKDGKTGWGEAAGIYFFDETASSMSRQLDDNLTQIESDCSFERIQSMLPAGGARNALDCAFWDLTSKLKEQTVWQRLSLTPQSLSTVFTISIGTPSEMASAASAASNFEKLKVKLDANMPIERIEQIRRVRPDASILIDVNGGWTFDELRVYAPALVRYNIDLIEQPLPRGADEELTGYCSAIPLAGDESCIDRADLEAAMSRYDVINIKLDKTGGLTEALALAKAAREQKCGLMVGNMTGSSLAMAPSFVIGQYCDFIDLDGPLMISEDVPNGMRYAKGGVVSPPSTSLWG